MKKSVVLWKWLTVGLGFNLVGVLVVAWSDAAFIAVVRAWTLFAEASKRLSLPTLPDHEARSFAAQHSGTLSRLGWSVVCIGYVMQLVAWAKAGRYEADRDLIERAGVIQWNVAGESRRSANIARILAAFSVVAGVGYVIWLGSASPWLMPQSTLSVATLILGITVLSWQLERQHMNTLVANRTNARDKLYLDIYNEITKRIEAASDPLADIGTMPMGFMGAVVVFRGFRGPVGPQPISGYRSSRLRSASSRGSSVIIAVMSVLEVYEIVMPEFVVFRKRLAETSRQLTTAAGDFTSLALPYLDRDDAGPYRWPPTDSESAEMSRLASIVSVSASEIQGALWDLRVDASNYLLGGLFPGRRVPERAPTDPAVTVTRISDRAS